MKKQKKKKLTTYEIIDLIFTAVSAIAALISVIRWW